MYMGRYYCGDIEGKFWVGIQSSDDIEELVTITPHTYYCWKVCGCTAEIDDDEYCKACYSSKEDHIENAIEDEEYDDESLYIEECSQGYSLDKETHYQELKENMEKIKQKLPEEIVHMFEEIKQTDDILNAFTGVFDKPLSILNNIEDDKQLKLLSILVARYTLGTQIEYCLRTKESCNVTCEY